MRSFVFDPAGGKGTARLTSQVSTDQIPLAHIKPPTLAAAQCVAIEQTGSATADISLLGTYSVDAAGMIEPVGGIDSALPAATAVFLDGAPCFYRHRLSLPVRLPTNTLLWHPDAPVVITGVPVRLTATPGPSPELYWIDVYMTESLPGTFALYDAVNNGVDVHAIREAILAMPALRVEALASVAVAKPTDPVGSIEAVSPTRSRLQTSLRPVTDTRTRLSVTWRVQVFNGYTMVTQSATQTVQLLAMEQATTADAMTDGWLTVSADPLAIAGVNRTGNQYLHILTDSSEVEVDCHPHGGYPVRLRWRSGQQPIDLPDQFALSGGQFVPNVAIGAPDSNLPYVSVSGRSLEDPWHVRVRLGRQTKVVDGVTYRYALPEYNSDLFSPIPPYSKQEEMPVRIDEHRFRVGRTPIDPGVPVTAEIRLDEPLTLSVAEIDPEYGLVRLRESVPENAPLVISYAIRKDYVTYRGDLHYLDLNPRHLTYLPLGQDFYLTEGRRLIGRPLYLYWLPYAKMTGLVEEPLRELTLTHSFVVLSDPTAILLATLTVDVPFGPASLRILDARRRGGGLEESILNAPSMADMGTFDGTPTALSGAYVVEIAPWAAVTDPGQVRQVAEARGPFGQLPLVSLIDWPESILLGPEALWGDTVEVN